VCARTGEWTTEVSEGRRRWWWRTVKGEMPPVEKAGVDM
jgi:hypothetical protein